MFPPQDLAFFPVLVEQVNQLMQKDFRRTDVACKVDGDVVVCLLALTTPPNQRLERNDRVNIEEILEGIH